MQLVRTTLRIRPDLKKAVELMAFQQGKTFQDIFSQALELHLRQMAENKAKKIVFVNHDLGLPLDNLRREDYYDED